MKQTKKIHWGVAQTLTLALSLGLASGCGSDSAPSNVQAGAEGASDATASAQPAHSSAPKAASTDSAGKAKGAATAAGSSAWEALGKLDVPKNTTPSTPATPALTADGPDSQPEPTAAPGKELKRAGVGMGEKGRGYGGGIITTPVKVFWTVKEQLALDLIQHAMQLFKAEDPNGRGPKTHEEFMKKIVKDNDIKLPTLPEGHRYLYDPKTEELYVEQPKEP